MVRVVSPQILLLLGALFATMAFAGNAGSTPQTVGPDDQLINALRCGDIGDEGKLSIPFDTNAAIRVLIIGSSSTSGTGAGGSMWRYTSRTQAILHENVPLRAITVHAAGIGGERASGARARLADEIDRHKPDLVVWQVGTNDALHKIPLADLRAELVAGHAETKARDLPLVLVDPQYFPRIAENQHYKETVALLERFAEEHSLPLVKRFQRMKMAEEISSDAMAALLAKDRFHMSASGHECLARDLAGTLKTVFFGSR